MSRFKQIFEHANLGPPKKEALNFLPSTVKSLALRHEPLQRGWAGSDRAPAELCFVGGKTQDTLSGLLECGVDSISRLTSFLATPPATLMSAQRGDLGRQTVLPLRCRSQTAPQRRQLRRPWKTERVPKAGDTSDCPHSCISQLNGLAR